MSVETFSSDQAITVTPEAAEHFAEVLNNKVATGVRLSLKESGCTGFKYVIDEVENGEPGDQRIELENGVHLFFSPNQLSALNGLVVDYVQQGLCKNLVMNNPNIKDMCGCGESFSVQ